MLHARGLTLAEVLVTVALAGIALSVTLPSAERLRTAGRAAAGARRIATAWCALRWKSVAVGRGHGMFFRRDADGWSWVEVRDGNGNGIRTAEVRDGTDPVVGKPRRLDDGGGTVRFGFPALGTIPKIPPGRGLLRIDDDPIRFGRGDLVAFSPTGQASSGTLYVTDGRRALYAVVLFGKTSRVRVWRFDPRRRTWSR